MGLNRVVGHGVELVADAHAAADLGILIDVAQELEAGRRVHLEDIKAGGKVGVVVPRVLTVDRYG